CFFAQDLPKGWAPGEEAKMPAYLENKSQNKSSVIVTPPPYKNLRNAAEWEEIQTLNITWTSFTAIHREIIKAAQNDAKITIICSDSNTVKSNLVSNSVPLANIQYLQVGFNSIWARDYSGNTVYSKNVDSLLLVDWIYNRPRPLDDVTPTAIANLLNIPIYETKTAPNDLIHTGGNYMSDGFGTAFSSTLTDQENPGKTSAQIDTIMKWFMGINRYIRMPTLPYDGIHHIDMHMKLLDEETLLWGEYPAGVADGPQIEANLQYVLANHMSVFGTPYKIVRIPMPKDKNNKWPNQSGGWYCTYTNGVFVNKTYIFPTYYQQYDTTAYRILTQSLPGYKVVGIDCDNTGAAIISQSGAIHCITHAVGVNDPLLISHQRLAGKCDTGLYEIKARIMHKSGIATAQVFWTTDTTQAYQTTNMTLTNVSTDEYTANIPFQTAGQTVYYYISASSVSGKTLTRPITAPLGRWTFKINPCAIPQAIKEEKSVIKTKPIYPNPANAITCIPLHSNSTQHVKVNLRNTLGQLVEVIYDGQLDAGDKNVFLFADKYAKGVYMVEIASENNSTVQKLIIK
ncbi:MAG: Por secretion system C-terminal sorting protein, partial [Bacteroidetes bacterium]|nr:Por secretion system C-terminal sorting protein [Bacteroidota bacterium]